MVEGEVRQYFVRNDRGTVWGPLALATIELLIENGDIQGRIQVSEDGIRFAFPGHFPHIRDAFPRALWGDVVAPATPMARPGVAAPRSPMPTGAAPMAGPGTRPAAPPPGAVPQPHGAVPQAPRPPPGAPSSAAARPMPPGAAPQAPRPPPGAPPGAATRPTAPGAAPQQPAPAPASRSVDVPPPSGTFKTHSPVRLYGVLAAGGLTGLLTLTLADRTIRVHFRKGNPEFIDSSHPEDALGTSLLQARLVTAEQLQQAEAAKARFGGELVGALFGLGLLQPATAFTHLGQRAQAILLKGLSAETGSFTCVPKELPPHKAMPLGNKWAVLSDLVRRIPAEELRRRLQPVVNLPVMKSSGRVAVSELRLTPHEVRALAVIDGARSLGQLLTGLPQDAEHVTRLVFLLNELDAVSFASVPQRAAPPPSRPQPPAPTAGTPPSSPPPAAAPSQAVAARPAPPPPAAPQAPRPGPAAPAAAQQPAAPAAAPAAPPTAAQKPAAPTAAQKPAAPAATQKPAAPAAAPAPSPGTHEIPVLRELAAKLKEQNHFERLGLGADCNGPAVKIAYFKLAKQYHPDTLPPGAPPELEKLKADVFAYIGEAYRTLSDDKSRAAYLEDLKSGGGGDQEVDVEAILKAEELFRKAGLYLKARKFSDVVALLDEAIQLNPEEPEFYAWRGYARFYTCPDKKTGFNEAFRDITLCLKKNDKVVAAHYYLGVIAKACGDHGGALKHFQKTVELQPNHIEAQREIRLATQRK